MRVALELVIDVVLLNVSCEVEAMPQSYIFTCHSLEEKERILMFQNITKSNIRLTLCKVTPIANRTYL
jgi:hypothetical protein